MYEINWSTLPALSTLRAFEATARLQGYSAASRALNVTPAAIAQQVRKLESEIGTALVRREGRGLALTDAGRQLSQSLHEAFSVIAHGIRDVQIAEDSRGVRVSTTDYFASSVALPQLGAFWKQHPTLKISFSPDGNTAPVDLENFDVVVRAGAPGRQWEGHQSLALLETPMIVCASPELLGSGPVDPATLPWISDRGIGGGVFERAIEQAGYDLTALTLVDPGNAKLELEATLMGYGLHVGPELTIRDHLADGTLVRVDIDLGMTGVYYAIYRKGPVPAPTRKLLDWLVEICRPLSIT